jgi:predicted DNA-binding ribbon-helix-helix protein
MMNSTVVKRSVVINHHKTSVSLEDAFWKGIKQIAAARNMTLSDLVASVNGDRRQGNLSSALRLFVLEHYRAKANGMMEPGERLSQPDERTGQSGESAPRAIDPLQDMRART